MVPKMEAKAHYNIEMTDYLLRKDSVGSDVNYEFIDISVDQKDIKKRRNSSFHKIRSIFIDYTEKHELEQKFLLKLDFFLLGSATLGYIVKYLNQNNLSTAYVNGMDDYYHMDKNQYNYLNTCWSAGYFIGQIVSASLLHYFPPRLFLGSLEIVWGLLTLSMVYSEKLSYVYVIRFLVGLTESAFFPSIEYLLGSWYNSDEITKRSTLVALSSSFAKIVTGPIQVLILEWYDEVTASFQPFQYLFLFDVFVSIPVGIVTIFCNPDTPTTTKSWYWNSQDRLVALERRRRSGALSPQNVDEKTGFSWVKVKEYLTCGETYLFPLVFICYNNSGLTPIAMTTYLRDALGYSAKIYNLYPSIMAIISMAVALVVGYLSDYFKGRKNYVFILSYFTCVMFGSFLLAFQWDNISVAFHIFLYFVIGVPSSFGQPMIFSWINRHLVHDDLKRHFTVVVTNTIPYFTSILHIIVWDTRQQPRFKVGYIYNVVLAVTGIVATVTTIRFTVKKLALRDIERSRFNSHGSLGTIEEEEILIDSSNAK